MDETRSIPGTWDVIDDEGNFKMTWSDSKTVVCPKPINGNTKDSVGEIFTKQKVTK
jgi:hypothetical protein